MFFRFCKNSKKTTFSVFLSFFLVKSPKSQSLKLNISRTAWPILMILVSFCRILNGLSDEINLFWRCSSPLNRTHLSIVSTQQFSACRQLKYPCISEKSDNHSLCICYSSTGSLSTLLGTPKVYTNSSFFGHFDGLHQSTFKSYGRIHSIDFPFFFQNQIFRYIFIIPNCRLVENILDTFCITQIWHGLSISGMFTVAKCRGHTNFVLSKVYEGYFQQDDQFSLLAWLLLSTISLFSRSKALNFARACN